MKRFLLSLVLLGTVTVFAQEPAVEKHGETAAAEEHEMPNEIWWKWANFAILAAGLGYLIGKNAGPFFASRTNEIQKGIKDAAAVKADAEARAKAIESRLTNLDAEIQALRKNSQAEIAAEGARISAETAQAMAKIQTQSEQEIAAAAKNASLELKAQAASLAMEIAEQQIRGRLNSQTQDALVDTFVKDLQQEAKTKAALN